MPELAERLHVSIDTTSHVAGIALFEAGVVLAQTSWRTRQSHSRQLLPALDWLLSQLDRGKADIAGFIVTTGPGSYAGMRVGLSTAKTLAYALDVPLVGIGRLAADALSLAEVTLARVVPLQIAGRAELAYAAYKTERDSLNEVLAPGLAALPMLVKKLQDGDIVCGEIDRLDDASREAIAAPGARIQTSDVPRAVSAGRLGLVRMAEGSFDNPDTLVPLYLRAPAIGPQPPR